MALRSEYGTLFQRRLACGGAVPATHSAALAEQRVLGKWVQDPFGSIREISLFCRRKQGGVNLCRRGYGSHQCGYYR